MWALNIWRPNTRICKASKISRVIPKGKYTDPITLVLHHRALKRKVNKKHQSTKRQAVINIWSWYGLSGEKKNHLRLKFTSLCTLLRQWKKKEGLFPSLFLYLDFFFFFLSFSLSEKAGKYFDTQSINQAGFGKSTVVSLPSSASQMLLCPSHLLASYSRAEKVATMKNCLCCDKGKINSGQHILAILSLSRGNTIK